MEYYKIPIIILIIITAISCKDSSNNNSKFVPLTISSNEPVSIKLTKMMNIGTLDIQEKTATINKETTFKVNQKPDKITLCFLLVNDDMSIFFIGPNMERNIIIEKDENNKINFVFNQNDQINNFTKKFHKEIRPLMRNSLGKESMLKLINKKEKELLSELQLLKPSIDKVSYKILSSMVTGKIAHIKFMIGEQFKTLTVHSPYYDFVDNVKFTDDNYLTYTDNLNTVLSVLRTQYERKYNKSFNDADDKLDFVNATIKNKEVKSAIICFLASKTIPEQTESDKEKLIKHLNQFSIKPNYLKHINNIKASTAVGKKIGNKARYLETLMPYNEDFSIKQLEGKTVYIDNWATWCGPCIKSMKAFKEKQEALNKINDIIFVFVSFDRNEKIWRNYVNNSFAPNQKIIHLYNGTDMNSEYGKYYNISGLPSYLLVDKQGLIYDINPKTPKDKKFVDYLNQLYENKE